MKRVYTYLYLMVLMIVLTTSCSVDDSTIVGTNDVVVPESVEVLIGVNSSETRTSIADDEMTVNWEASDKIAIWAVGNTDGNVALDGDEFQIKYFYPSASGATFAANISPFDDGQSYTYRGLYPSTASNDGSTVSYTLPTTQSGLYEGDLDLRVAKPTVNSALTGSDDDNVELSFEALTHLLKITIPEGENWASAPIKTLYLDFPTSVVGTVSCDFTGETLTPTLINGSSSITIELGDDRTIDAGDGTSVWVFINPVSGVSGDLVISALSTNDFRTQDYTIALDNHTFSAGHVTPINSRIEEEYPTTTIDFSIDNNYLGEDVETVTLTAPSGVVFIESGSNVATFTVNSSNKYSVSYITDFYGAAMSLGSLAVSFESENAIKSGSAISSSSIVSNVVNTFSQDVPYLFEEDFSGISGTDAYNGLIDTDLSGISYWTDGRIYNWWDSNCIAIKTYYYLNAETNGYLNLELSGLTGLKSGKTVTLKIAFDAGWKQNYCSSMKMSITNDDSYSGSITFTASSTASSSYKPQSVSTTVSNCDSESILTFKNNGTADSYFKMDYDYVYMDNIKISISN